MRVLGRECGAWSSLRPSFFQLFCANPGLLPDRDVILNQLQPLAGEQWITNMVDCCIATWHDWVRAYQAMPVGQLQLAALCKEDSEG